MWEALDRLLSGNFMPHGHCYLWSPAMVWLQVLSNLFIAFAYVSISTTLYVIIRRIKDIPFSWMYLAFGVFIITCGGTHFLDVITIWHPIYWLDGGLRGVTAIASVGTALMLFPLVPKAIGLANAAQVSHERGERLEATYKELASAHEKTKELERLKTQLFANVSHELRTPLTLVLGPTERLLAGSDLTPAQRRDLELVNRNARALLGHVNALLDVAKLEAGQVQVHHAHADLAEVVRLTASHFEGLAKERAMRFTLAAPPRLAAEFDVEMLQRVTLNLLANAFKFTPDGGAVRCTVSLIEGAPPARVRIEVADSGPGVRAALRERVFERFAQGDTGLTRSFAGTGLGLAIVKELVELHTGTVHIDDAPEGGAAFLIELPVAAPAGVAVAADPLTAGASQEELVRAVDHLRPRTEVATAVGDPSRPTVLVVDDNHDMNEFVAETLGTAYHVERAFDGAEGLAKARSLLPDAIVTDVMMPGMSGDELVGAIRRDRALDAIPIVLLTAKADDDLRIRTLGAGAQDYVMKPFYGEELRARVDNLVTLKRARDVLQSELSSKTRDVETLALDLRARQVELAANLEELTLARDRADEASRVKTSFLGLVSHELRTPLTSMQLLIDRLSESQDFSARQRSLVDRVAASASRLTDLVDSLLHHTRIQSGRLALNLEPFDLDLVAREAAEEVRPLAQRKSLTLSAAPSAERVRIESDPKLVRLIVVNLVANAVKFTDLGTVTVKAEVRGDRRVVRVTDTGPGIDAMSQKLIFEPFQQLEPTRHKHLPGVGLGLSLARQIVTNLGGEITVRSEMGKGSTFEVVLPAVLPSARSEVES